MRSRRPENAQPPERDLQASILRLLPQIRRAAALMGFTEEQIVTGGIVLFCTFILNGLASGVAAREAAGKGKPKWQVEQVVSALASRCGSTGKPKGGSSERRKSAGCRSQITSVGAVLSSLVRREGRRGRGNGLPGS